MPIRGDLDSYGNLLATINIKYKKFTEEELGKIKKIFEAGTTRSEDELWSLAILNKIFKTSQIHSIIQIYWDFRKDLPPFR